MIRYVFVIWNIALILEVARATVSAADNIDSDIVGLKGGDCLANSLNNSLYCRSSRAIRNIINNLSRSDKPLVLMRGLEIVSITSKDNKTEKEYQQRHPTNDDDSFLSLVTSFLRTHELNLKFSDLFGDENETFLPHYFRQSTDKTDSHSGPKKDLEVEARKKDKGQGIVLAVALMFGKMLAILGLGSIAAVAMKALGVAIAALMMAGLVGVKSLAQNGHENSHSISYLTSEGHHHHNRRRRSATKPDVYDPLTLIYSSWQNNVK